MLQNAGASKELMGSVFGFGCTYTKRPSERCHAVSLQTKPSLSGVCDGNLINFICPCIPTFVHVSWNLTSIMSGEYLIRPYQAMKNCRKLCFCKASRHGLFSATCVMHASFRLLVLIVFPFSLFILTKTKMLWTKVSIDA